MKKELKKGDSWRRGYQTAMKEKEGQKSWEAEAIWDMKKDTIAVADWHGSEKDNAMYKFLLERLGKGKVKLVKVKITII